MGHQPWASVEYPGHRLSPLRSVWATGSRPLQGVLGADSGPLQRVWGTGYGPLQNMWGVVFGPPLMRQSEHRITEEPVVAQLGSREWGLSSRWLRGTGFGSLGVKGRFACRCHGSSGRCDL